MEIPTYGFIEDILKDPVAREYAERRIRQQQLADEVIHQIKMGYFAGVVGPFTIHSSGV